MTDVVCIGGGINGLAAAVLLGRAGWRVLVLDRNDTVGGAVQTRELTLPGFCHDLGAMNLSVFAHSAFFATHRAALAERGVEIVTADHPFGSVVADGRFLGIGTDPEANRRAIAAFAAADAAAWDVWSADYDRYAPLLFRLLGAPARHADLHAHLHAAAAELAPADVARLRGLLLDTLRANLAARFRSEAARALVAAWGLHLDYAPDVAGGCWMPFLETNTDARDGIALIKGGSGRLMTALADLVQAGGGAVRTGATVERIIVEHGRAAGVVLAGGEEIRCARAVVASVTPTALLRLAGADLPAPAVERARSWQYGPGTMLIHLALAELPEWRAVEARRSFYVHIGPSLDHLAEAYRLGVAGRLAAEPFCVVGQPTLYDPSRAPAGRHVLWIMVRAVPGVIRGDAAGTIAGPTWDGDATQAFAGRVLDVVERHAPRLRRRILAMAVHSPADLERMDPNLVGGDLGAGSHHLAQFYGARPFPDSPCHETSIAGLYLCGASTWPGAGASPGSGVLLAQHLLATDAEPAITPSAPLG